MVIRLPRTPADFLQLETYRLSCTFMDPIESGPTIVGSREEDLDGERPALPVSRSMRKLS
jgi:hypothetical protein